MKNWTKPEILLLFIANVLIALVARSILPCFGQLFPNASVFAALFTLFAIPFIFSAAGSFCLKKRGKKLNVCVVVLTGLEFLLVILSQNLTFAAQIAKTFTGHYNLEAVGFSLLFAIIYCSGLLVGCGLGYCFQRWYKSKPT